MSRRPGLGKNRCLRFRFYKHAAAPQLKTVFPSLGYTLLGCLFLQLF